MSRLVRMPTSLPLPALDHREAGDRRVRAISASAFAQRRVGMDGQRIDDHAALVPLHLAHLVGLFLGVEVAVQDTPMPPAWAMAIASRPSVTVSIAEETRGMLRRIARVAGSGVDLGRHHFRRAGFQQNVVEGEPFANPMKRLHHCQLDLRLAAATIMGMNTAVGEAPGLAVELMPIGGVDGGR